VRFKVKSVHGNIVKNLAKSLLLPSVFASLSCILISNFLSFFGFTPEAEAANASMFWIPFEVLVAQDWKGIGLGSGLLVEGLAILTLLESAGQLQEGLHAIVLGGILVAGPIFLGSPSSALPSQLQCQLVACMRALRHAAGTSVAVDAAA
jgi:hypothetical protein